MKKFELIQHLLSYIIRCIKLVRTVSNSFSILFESHLNYIPPSAFCFCDFSAHCSTDYPNLDFFLENQRISFIRTEKMKVGGTKIVPITTLLFSNDVVPSIEYPSLALLLNQYICTYIHIGTSTWQSVTGSGIPYKTFVKVMTDESCQ